MDSNLEHEDLLIKLRAKLNEEKIKLWEPPFVNNDENKSSQNLQELASKFSEALNIDNNTVLLGLQELQVHSIERVKANEEFKETGCATFRVRVSLAGEKPKELKIAKHLAVSGNELMQTVSDTLNVDKSRIKLIHNGKVLKPNPSLEEQGVKNGAQIMALVLTESPERLIQEDNRYMEMKSTLDDATLLTENVEDDDGDDDDEYMKLEDQSGKAVDLPATEKRALMVGLALHERGRTAANARDYALALVLFLEADRQFSACRSSLLSAVDNWALLQLDVAWSYLRLRQLRAAPDAAARLENARRALKDAYGDDCQRVIALKGNAANERVMFARLYLLQGIVAYHQNKREEARELLETAERELNSLKVDEQLVHNLVELGWSESQARWGLRAGGSCDRAHDCLLEARRKRQEERDRHRQEREQRLLGICVDGSPVSRSALQDLLGMGFKRHLAVAALKNSNNNVTDAVRLIHDHPEMFDSDGPSDDASSDETPVEPDNRLVSELVAMGYELPAARDALTRSRNRPAAAVELLLGGGACDSENPSTSGEVARKRQKRGDKKRKKERETALRRLKQAINADEEEYLGASLSEEEEFLRQYKALI